MAQPVAEFWLDGSAHSWSEVTLERGIGDDSGSNIELDPQRRTNPSPRAELP